MTAIADRRANGIRTRNRPAVPGAPFISELERAAPGGVATLEETTTLIPTSQLGTGIPDATKALFGNQTWQAAATAAALAAEIAARIGDVDAEEAARIAADAAHVAAADPHAQYQKESEKDGNNGYLGADANARLTSTRLSMSATDKLVGRSTVGAGASEEIVCTAAGRALIDDADAAAQRTTLGLGTAATKDVPAAGDAAAGEVVKGSDSRLTNARTPAAHASSHAPDGSDPISTSGTFTPSFTGLTVVNGTGGASYAGYWFKVGKLVYVLIEITVTGTCTTASTANSTRVTNLPFTVTRRGTIGASDPNIADLGHGLFYSGTTAWVSSWTARNVSVWLAGVYYTDD